MRIVRNTVIIFGLTCVNGVAWGQHLVLKDASSNDLPPRDISIRAVEYGGSGCPKGTLGSLEPDLDQFIELDELVARAGVDYPRRAGRRFCQLAFSLDIPSGWSVALRGIKAEGYASIDAPAIGTLEVRTYFQGLTRGPEQDASITVPLSGDYEGTFLVERQFSREELEQNSLGFSRCGTDYSMNVVWDVRASDREGDADATVEIDRIKLNGFYWRRCPSDNASE